MTVTAGMSDTDPRAGFRRDVCHFSDDRLSPAQKLGFVHELLGREMAEVRMFLDHVEKYSSSLGEADRHAPSFSTALDTITRDARARERYLEFARDADEPAVRARMLELAQGLGWLSPAQRRAEIMRMFGEQVARNGVGAAEVNLACSLNKDRELERDVDRPQLSPLQAGKVANAALLACLGSAEGHARVIRALASPDDDDVRIAQIYLRHRPLADANELRVATASVTRMHGSEAQARALDTLAYQRVSDRESLDELTRLFPNAKSVSVQRAIAGILIRADYQAIAKPELAQALRRHRLKSPDGEDVIDVLIRRLQLP
jgi:hypothetical protein